MLLTRNPFACWITRLPDDYSGYMPYVSSFGLDDGSEGGFVIIIDSENLTYKTFVSGQANGVPVARTCTVCDVTEDASAVAVTAKEINPTINCQEAQTLNYTATASFDNFTADNHGNLTVGDGVEKVT